MLYSSYLSLLLCTSSFMFVFSCKLLSKINCFIFNAIRDKRVVIFVRAFPINENTIWHPQIFPIIQGLPQSLHSKMQLASNTFTYYFQFLTSQESFKSRTNNYRVVSCVPITNQNSYIPVWGVKRNRNYIPIVNNKASKSARSSLKMQRRKVEKATNLIFNLKVICPVPLWRNWAIGTKNSILP